MAFAFRIYNNQHTYAKRKTNSEFNLFSVSISSTWEISGKERATCCVARCVFELAEFSQMVFLSSAESMETIRFLFAFVERLVLRITWDL